MSAQPVEPDIETLANGMTAKEIIELINELPEAIAESLIEAVDARAKQVMPNGPIEQAEALGEPFIRRGHLMVLDKQIADAVRDVEAGTSRRLVIEMPPRSGKTYLSTLLTAAWVLSCHPSWPIALTSHDGGLATGWGRQVRRWVETGRLGGHLKVAPDAGAASAWETTDGGKMLSISLRESFTGRGAKVLVIDDPHKDFVDAHSKIMRDNVWDWWLSVAQTRLEPPYLVIVIMTRWHEDDLVGRLLSKDYEGNPADWDVLRIPALADSASDPLGREIGEPLLSPLLATETTEQALERLAQVKDSVGTYVWASLYQQRPSPAKGAIFDADAWRFWTADPSRAENDPTGKVVYLEPGTLSGGRWLDSWDMSFKGTEDSDYVVGQRWVRYGASRYLIAQQRDRWTFTQSLARLLLWSNGGGPHGRFVHQRLVEEKANGAAIIDVLNDKVAGLKAINPAVGKEARARSVTPEVESGHVYLPHPGDPGNAWVKDLLSELTNFPHDVYDDCVDALTQALIELRDTAPASVTVPAGQIDRDVAMAAKTDATRLGRGFGPAQARIIRSNGR